MTDERKFIQLVDRANAAEFASLLQRPTIDQERALRAHWGDERYERMHELALRQPSTARGTFNLKGNVVVIHGIMGAELSVFDSPTSGSLVWVSVLHLIRGWVPRLELNPDGRTGAYDVRATGIMKDFYGEMVLSLRSLNWNAQAFWFDWRRDIFAAADDLHAKIAQWFGPKAPVHIVAHSMGGLVARALIRRYPEHWKSMLDPDGARTGGRLIMLGTPTYGSFTIPQVATGIEPTVHKLSYFPPFGIARTLEVVNTFPGSYQMLPSPAIMPAMQPLYRAATYKTSPVAQPHLDAALQFHKEVDPVFDADRMIYVAGTNQITWSNISNFDKIDSLEGYGATLLGDGRVTHELGIPRDANGKPLANRYYVDDSHGELSRNQSILSQLDILLTNGGTDALSKAPAKAERALRSPEALRKELADRQQQELEQFRTAAGRVSSTRGGAEMPAVSGEERIVRELLVGGKGEVGQAIRPPGARRPLDPTPLQIRLVWAGIEEIGHGRLDDRNLPIDALAVGHYLGSTRLLAAESALDETISRALLKPSQDSLPEEQRILTQFAQRGLIHGELGHPFLLSDPRSQAGRVICLAGMGVPGRFLAPELTVLARELCWALGRLGKQHLATVLIGSGQGNLKSPEAARAWIRGLRHALTGSQQDETRRLRRVTFVEHDPAKLEEIRDALLAARGEEAARAPDQPRLAIDFRGPDLDTVKNSKGKTIKVARHDAFQEEIRRRKDAKRPESDPLPSRLTVTYDGKRYRFGAITEGASMPEREVILNPSLVSSANDELILQRTADGQFEHGRYMHQLLIPTDMREALMKDAPVVMILDSDTARLHWEMLALVEKSSGKAEGAQEDVESFLSTSRGITRQLRTSFAPLPEPPPPARRILRVLVVADPAEDARLAGAEEEGRAVAELFEAFNRVYPDAASRVEVVRMLGPAQATLSAVHFRVTREAFDVLHFAGHCFFNKENPSASGWIFTGGQALTANELSRIDHVPKFVFSNACESGVTPDRVDKRSAALAPSFAEAFFGRGVANFVCTGWPVDDQAAQTFALKLYGKLLGLEKPEKSDQEWVPCPPEPIHKAMVEARRTILAPNTLPTWAAYQHYGNPYFRFFERSFLDRTPPDAAQPRKKAKK